MSDLVTEFATLWKDMHPLVAAACEKVHELRAFDDTLDPKMDVADIRERKLVNSGRLSSIEEVLANLGRLRRRAKVAEAQAKDAYMDARAKAITGGTAVEYSTGEERSAAYDLAALNERVVYRRTRDRAAELEEAYEYVRTLYFGLGGERSDLHDAIESMNVEARLDR